MKFHIIQILSVIFIAGLSGCASAPAAAAAPSKSSAPTAAAPGSSPAPLAAASPDVPSPTPTPAPVELIGAGDIAYCGPDDQDEATAAILARFPDAQIFAAGDDVSGEGKRAEYANCFAPSWGKFLDRLHPVPGNHDYMTEGGAPYYEYFGAAAGQAGQGYYSFDLGTWHIVGLNSNCDAIACGPNSAQANWLKEDLAANAKTCTLLFWHHPRYSSGIAGNYGPASTFWRIALEAGADVVVSGHDHDYERFAPQDGDGNADPNGVRQFVVGTGGSQLRDFGQVKPNSEVRDNSTHGVILFKLYPDRYEWQFLPVEGGTFTDSGSAACSR